jgi:hypothetical protein
LSRLRSSRGAKAAAPATKSGARATVAAAGRRPGVLVQAPKSDIFVAMLGVALGAIVLACLLMLLILWRYDFKANAKLAAHDAGTRVRLAEAEPAGHLPAPFRG